MTFKIKNALTTFIKDNRGVAFIESALLLPMMLTLLFGLYDLGQAIIINQKVTAAAHMASDLITRQSAVDNTDINDAYGAAQMVIDPYDRTALGIDITGIQYDEDDIPQEMWRETRNMTQNINIPDDASGLGINGEGVVAVTVTYDYRPFFTQSIIGAFNMSETAYMRGRRSSFVRFIDEEDQ